MAGNGLVQRVEAISLARFIDSLWERPESQSGLRVLLCQADLSSHFSDNGLNCSASAFIIWAACSYGGLFRYMAFSIS